MKIEIDPGLPLKRLLFLYIETGSECYQTVYNYIKNGSKGNLNLSYTPITRLPQGLNISGNLNLSYTKITNLPENLNISGNLNLFKTKITNLPKGLSVGGYLCLYNTPIGKKYTNVQLKKMLPNVKGEIYI